MTQPIKISSIAKPAEQQRQGVCKWAVNLDIRLPYGVVRHPRMLDLAEEAVGRPTAVKVETEDIGISFGLFGDSRSEVSADCEVVCDRVLGRLGLGRSALHSVEIYERDPRVFGGPAAHLQLMPDLD